MRDAGAPMGVAGCRGDVARCGYSAVALGADSLFAADPGRLDRAVDVSLPRTKTRKVGLCRWLPAAALLLCAAPVAFAQEPAGHAAPAWKQIYEDNQTVFYVDAAGLPTAGDASVTALLEYKVPQVIGGSQVWSILSHMKVSCGQNRMVTADNTLYALKMASGPAVQSQPSNDTWHAPQPNTLGGLVWGAACAKA